MYLQMKLRHYNCVGCGTPCKSTSAKGVGEGKEPAESAAEISAVDGGTASRLIANRAIALVVENSGIARRQR